MSADAKTRKRAAGAEPTATAAPDPAAATVTPITAGRQTPRRLRRAAEILAAAREVFLDKGFERASVAEIAARVGVVEGLVYTYFPTKRDLLNEVLRGLYEPLIQDIAETFERLHGLRSRLRFLVWRQLRVYVEEPSLSRIVLHEVRTSADYPDSVLHDLHVRYTSFTLRTVREAIRDGELPPETEPEMVRSMLYGGIEHRMWSTLFGRGTIDVEATADRYTDLLLHGLLPAPRASVAAAAQARTGIDPAAVPTGSDAIERRLARLERLVAAAWPDEAGAPLALPPPAAEPPRRPARRRKDPT